MAYTALKFPDEPIVVARVKLPLEHNLSAVRHLWNQVNRQADEARGPFVAVLDFSDQPPDFADILLWIDERRTPDACQYRSPNLYAIAIGTHPMLSLALRKIKRQIGDEAIQMPTLNDALVYARRVIAAAHTESSLP